ncbi:MAG: hypothetical protein NT061_12220 [Spirochaetes bacterium]|nr:hypothetical protein [Spirochaetota bacterium]
MFVPTIWVWTAGLETYSTMLLAPLAATFLLGARPKHRQALSVVMPEMTTMEVLPPMTMMN